MIRLIGAAIALSICAPAWGQTCTIVTNGDLDIYDHELAHCNGWWHEPYQPDVQPPLEFVYDYPGKLNVILGASFWRDPVATLLHAQEGAKVVTSRQRVPEICKRLWRERSVSFNAAKAERIVGCSVRD